MKIIDDNGTDTLGVPYVMFQPVRREDLEDIVRDLGIPPKAEVEAYYCKEKMLLRLVVKIDMEKMGDDLIMSPFMARHATEFPRINTKREGEE